MKLGKTLVLAMLLVLACTPAASALPLCDCNYCAANPYVRCLGPGIIKCENFYNAQCM